MYKTLFTCEDMEFMDLLFHWCLYNKVVYYYYYYHCHYHYHLRR